MNLEYGRDIAELFRRVNNLLRVGRVVSVDYTAARARVKIGDITTDFLPWMTPSTNVWIPLKNGEQVVVLSPCGDLGFGMILPSLYQTAAPMPSADIEKIVVVSDITQTGTLTCAGDIMATGKIIADDEVEGKGVKLSTHTHEFDYIGAGQGSSQQSATTKKPS